VGRQPRHGGAGSQVLFALDPTNDQFSHPANTLVVVDADGTDLRVVDDSRDFTSPQDWWS